MSEVINLRQARKAKQRLDANARADANRMKFGQTKADKHKLRVDAERPSGCSTAPDAAPIDRPRARAPARLLSA